MLHVATDFRRPPPIDFPISIDLNNTRMRTKAGGYDDLQERPLLLAEIQMEGRLSLEIEYRGQHVVPIVRLHEQPAFRLSMWSAIHDS